MSAELVIPNFDAQLALTGNVRAMGPAVKWQEVTLDEQLPGAGGRWLLVVTAGTIDYVAVDGDTVPGFPVGDGYHFFLFQKILSTSTATGLWWSS